MWLPPLSWPAIKMPESNLPGMWLPPLSWPAIKMPESNLPGMWLLPLSWPAIKMPECWSSPTCPVCGYLPSLGQPLKCQSPNIVCVQVNLLCSSQKLRNCIVNFLGRSCISNIFCFNVIGNKLIDILDCGVLVVSTCLVCGYFPLA